jgi:hypothetical protein
MLSATNSNAKQRTCTPTAAAETSVQGIAHFFDFFEAAGVEVLSGGLSVCFRFPPDLGGVEPEDGVPCCWDGLEPEDAVPCCWC